MNADTRQPAVLHLDMDAFYAAIEVRDRPELKGKPVVIGSPPDQRGVVSTASYEARTFGIHSAMPSRTAGALCPHAIFLPVDMKKYQAVSRQLMDLLDRYSPAIEPLSIDEAFLDLGGTRLLWPDPVALARDLKRRVRAELGLTASVGLAPNKFLAKLASDLEKPDGLTVVPGHPDAIRAFLAPLPVSRIWGVGKAGEERLHTLGLRTFADVQAADEPTLRAWLGDTMGPHIRRLAFGIDDRTVQPHREAKSLSAEHTFDDDTDNDEFIRRTLITLTEKVGRRLRKAGLYARTGQLKLRHRDFTTLTRQQALPEPTHSDAALRLCALEIYQRTRHGEPIRLIGFGASGLSDSPRDPRSRQLDLFEDPPDRAPSDDPLDRAVDRVRETFGPDALRRGGWPPAPPAG